MKCLVLMWKYHRMVAWFLTTVVLVLLFRLPFTGVQPIPYYLDFNPGIVLVPITGVFWGPAGAWGSLVAMLLSDLIMHMWGWLSLFRAMGVFFFALTAQRLWRVFCTRPQMPHGHAPDWTGTFGFLGAAWPGCFVAAAWVGLGSEVLGLYPFPYIVGLSLVHHLFFVTVLGVALYRIGAREIVPHFGVWEAVMGGDTDTIEDPIRRGFFLTMGGLCASLAGGVAAGLFYRIWPFQPYVIGTTCGIGVPLLVVPFLILHLMGFWRPGRSRKAGTGT